MRGDRGQGRGDIDRARPCRRSSSSTSIRSPRPRKETNDAHCDVARYIADLRARLLAEHLGCEPDDVASAVLEQGRLIDAIESLRCDRRSLRELDWTVDPEVDDLVPESAIIDPAEPLSPEYLVEEYVSRGGQSTGRRRLTLFAALVLGLLGLAAAWRWTPLQSLLSPERIGDYLASIPSAEGRALIAIGGFVIASLAMVPVTLLAVIGGVVFGGWRVFAYVIAIAVGLGTALLVAAWLGKRWLRTS